MNCDQLTAVSAKLETPNEEFVDIVDMYHMAIRQAAQSPYEVRRVSGYFRFAAFFLMNGWPKDFGHVRDSSNVNRPKVTQAIIDGDVEQAGMAMGQYILSGAFPG
ncbi:MAG: hypothetical protein KUG65_10215 [Sphingomonadaceae bacterium]|nr:hypothetical protein [Sphingomonadaceae bacterium]